MQSPRSSTISIVMNEPRDNPIPARIAHEDDSAGSLWRQLACSGSVFLWLVILLCLVMQPDILAAITLVPPWCWVVVGVLMAIIGFQRAGKRWSLLAIALWSIFAGVFVDETQGLWRWAARTIDPPSAKESDSDSLRVISLNCAGNAQAAIELKQYSPDVVLLQESPSRDQVAALTESLFGESGNFLHKTDTAILVRGSLLDQTPSDVNHFAHATARLASGREVDLVSLRLAPPVFRVDFWVAGFWTDHRDRRVEHREQIRQVVSQLEDRPKKRTAILGGDFNTTPIDLTLNELRAHAFDTFRAAGQGFGNTGTNQYPLFRVDQIWASRDIDAVSATARRSTHSDHRMVISELQLPAKAGVLGE